MDWFGFHKCMLLGFEGPDLARGCLLVVILVSVSLWVMVFWPVGHERVVVVCGTDRTLRTTQWTRASKRASSSPVWRGDVPLVNMQ